MLTIKYLYLTWVVMAGALIACQPSVRETQEPPAQPRIIPASEITPIDWAFLRDQVHFEPRYYEEAGGNFWFPSFTDSLKRLSGHYVEIEGYVQTLAPGAYALSAFPNKSCFFCGAAGPESVLELTLQNPEQIYFTDEYKRFAGVFALNDTNLDHLNFILLDAQEATAR
ncbi:MAG: DUF3299 domain-containing protein [Bacteroidia bacterium]|nr:DUF3299 domain-containing protein [Bacteroidia bacterium]